MHHKINGDFIIVVMYKIEYSCAVACDRYLVKITNVKEFSGLEFVEKLLYSVISMLQKYRAG